MDNKGKVIVGDYATKVVYSSNPASLVGVKINIDACFYKETNIEGLCIIAKDEIGNLLLASAQV
jgi:hypothetical protein